MAEALSAVASGIAVAQVAAQIGKSINKLKQLWDEFQDVPSSIGDLLDQINCLDPALWEAEKTFGQASLPPMFWDSSLGSRTTAYCRKASGSLTELVDELTLQLNRPGKLRSKVARAKIVLKKEQLRSLERRLQNAIRLLALAQQSYLITLTRIQPDIIIQRLMEITTSPITHALQDDVHLRQPDASESCRQQLPSQPIKSADNSAPEIPALTLRRSIKRGGDATSTVRFRLPVWLCRTAWELHSLRSYGNWKFHLRCYHTVRYDSEVFEVAQSGTPKDLQRLFASRQATPYDRQEDYGDTLLHAAVWGFNGAMVKYLLDVGLNPFETNWAGEFPINAIEWPRFGNDLDPSLADWSFRDQLKELFDVRDVYLNSESKECHCRIGLISTDFLSTSQRLECPWHEETTLESRLRSLQQVAISSVQPMVIPDLFRRYWIQDLRALCTVSLATSSLIHIVALGLGEAHSDPRSTEWASLAKTVIINTPSIHHLAECQSISWYLAPLSWKAPVQLTPLMVVIKAAAYASGGVHQLKSIAGRFTSWLSNVQTSGHDLEEYGRRENELLADTSLELNNECLFVRGSRADEPWRYITGRIRGYHYGPEPEDWRILWSFPEKSYVADFWGLVEDGPQLVPGAWVEDSDDDGRDHWFG
ncbi:hypothetical protein F5B21DRAFT_515030 [Xylaria acuta]|nr:hypothetical protein F5B21DRAFT_515030 [Xylaria acuta]